MLYQNGDPALGVARSYISSNIRKGVMFTNTEGYSNKEVDDLFARAAVQTSDKEAGGALQQGPEASRRRTAGPVDDGTAIPDHP
jgi:hypothetical protein